MVSGLKAATYEARVKELGLQSLEERRHQADMCMMHKILQTEDGPDSGTWFMPAGASGHGTRTAADDANVKVKSGKLELTPEEKLFHCAGIRAVEFNPLSHQA